MGSSWTCVSSLQLRGLEASGGDWSEDGSVLGVAFEHLVTLWDTSSRLRSTLSVQGGHENVSKVCFGKGASARLVFFRFQQPVDRLGPSQPGTFLVHGPGAL